MSFDKKKFDNALSQYLDDCVTINFKQWGIQLNPVGTGPKPGRNFDVGETHSYSLEIINNGPLGMLNVHLIITCRHGKLSGTYSGNSSILGSHWMAPWGSSLMVRAFNLKPNETYLHRHEFSTGNLFGYNIETPTAGTDNNRAVEDLLTAKIFSWQPDVNNYILKPEEGPSAIMRDFIQRS